MTDDELWQMTNVHHPFPVRLQTTQALAKMKARDYEHGREITGGLNELITLQTGAEVFGEYYLTLFMLGHDVAVVPPEIFDFDLMQNYVVKRYEANLIDSRRLPTV